MTRTVLLVVLLAAIGVLASFCIVVLDEREQAFRTFLDRPTKGVELLGVRLHASELTEPGVYFRVPFLHRLYIYDRRAQRYDAQPRELYMQGNDAVRVDYYVIWRTFAPALRKQTIESDARLVSLLNDSTFSAVKEVLGVHPFEDLLSDRREIIREALRATSDSQLRTKGIEVLDFRIREIGFPESNLENVYARMRTERNRFAKRYRAEGDEEAQKIRSDADRQDVILRAEGEREALRLRGEGDAEAARIYAEAYGQDREFYTFVRSLEAYTKALDQETTLILSPDSQFLKYLFPSSVAAPSGAQ